MSNSEASLDISSVDSDSYDSDDEDFRLEKEWQESLGQLQQLVSIVMLPFIGKYFGRRWSYWLFSRYTRLGLGKAFFLGGF